MNLFQFNCPSCNQPLEADDNMLGMELECPSCGKTLKVPSKSTLHPPSGEKLTHAVANVCPDCKKGIADGAIICVNCGLNLKSGKRLVLKEEPEHVKPNRFLWLLEASPLIPIANLFLYTLSMLRRPKILVLIIIVFTVGYFLFAPSRVKLSTYEKIRLGMSPFQVEFKLGTGLLHVAFRGVEIEQDKGEEILNEFAKDSRGGTQNILRQRAPVGTIKGTSVSNGGISHFDQDGLLAANSKDEYVSKEGTWKSDNTFVPAKRAKIRTTSFREGGIQKVSSYGEYEFHGYIEDMTISNKHYKLIRNGMVHFDPKPDGYFESWKGKDERIITVLFKGGKSTYWSYQGPAEDFSRLQPQSEVKVSAPESPVQKVVLKEDKLPVKEPVPSLAPPKDPVPAKIIEQPQPEVKTPTPESPIQDVAIKEDNPPGKEAFPVLESSKDPVPVKEVEQPKQETVPQPPMKEPVALKIEGYQKKIEEAKTSLESVRKKCAQAKVNYDKAVKQYSQTKASKKKPSNSDIDSKKNAYDALNAQMEKLTGDIQNYNLLISELKTKGHH